MPNFLIGAVKEHSGSVYLKWSVMVGEYKISPDDSMKENEQYEWCQALVYKIVATVYGYTTPEINKKYGL